MLKIRRSFDRLIFNKAIPLPGKDSLYIEMGPMSSAAMVLTLLTQNVLLQEGLTVFN